MEIERKFTIRELPKDLESYAKHEITQAYLCTDPVVRIRRQDDTCYLTYKGKGLMAREEYNLPLNAEAFRHLLTKADGRVINKTRYVIPLTNPKFSTEPSDKTADSCDLNIELDIFHGDLEPLIMAEVEFPDVESANAYIPEDWFLDDVTEDPHYHNSNMI